MPPPPRLLFFSLCADIQVFLIISLRAKSSGQHSLSYQAPTTWTRSLTRFQLPGLGHLPGSDYLDSFSYQAPTTWTFSPTRLQLPGLVHLPGSDYLDFFTYQAPTTWTRSLTRLRLPGLFHLPVSNYLDSVSYQHPTTWSRSLTRLRLPGTRLRLPGLILLPGSDYLDSFSYQALTTWTFSPTRLRLPGLIHLLAPTALNQLLVFVHHATSVSSVKLSLKTFTFQKPLLQSRFPGIHVCACMCVSVVKCLFLYAMQKNL